MNKLVLSLAIASTLGLSACDDESVQDVKNEIAENGSSVVIPGRVIFDPSLGIDGLSVPNDLIFQGTQDGTLEIPVADPTDGSDPFVAASALDGWATAQPFVLGIEFPDGSALDPSTALNSSSVRVFEAIMGGDATDADCATVSRGLACKIVKELVFSEDFITQASGNDVAFVPLKPLKGSTTYLIAMTNSLQDLEGNPVAGSTYYELMRQDAATQPLGDEAQRGLQAVINSYEDAVISAGVEDDAIIYTMAMTTQSTTDVLFTLKSLMLNSGNLPSINMTDTGLSAADVLAGQIPAKMVPLYSAANYMRGSITLPYYSGIPSAENPLAPTNTWWTGLCDSGAILAGSTSNELTDAYEEAIKNGTYNETVDTQCQMFGLRDIKIDKERNLTKYNPVPKQTASMPIDVQMTTPDLAWVNPVRASFGLNAIEEVPEGGWPVVIMQHGITSTKEAMLLATGMLSINGFATVAIDYPLHGSRGFDLTGNGEDDISASSVSALHYVNLASMLTMRDNTRQSAFDIFGLRLGLNYLEGVDFSGNPININSSKVHFLGHSLGAIYGINALALANTPLAPQVDASTKITSNVLAMPGLMLANFGMSSPAFSTLAKSNLVYNSSEAFQKAVNEQFPAGYTQDQLSAVYEGYYASLDDVGKAGLEAGFAQFTLIAQTVTGSGDPINYVGALAATQTPTLLFEVVGNGMDNLPDQVVTNTAPYTPLGGTEPAIALLGLPSVSETTMGSGAVRFVNGHHGSILDPRPNDASPDTDLSARVTQEMQSQMIEFFKKQEIKITDTEVVH